MDKEKGVIRGHKEKDRQPNERKRKGALEAITKRRRDNPMDKEREGSSEAIKRRRADIPVDKRERGHQRS